MTEAGELSVDSMVTYNAVWCCHLQRQLAASTMLEAESTAGCMGVVTHNGNSSGMKCNNAAAPYTWLFVCLLTCNRKTENIINILRFLFTFCDPAEINKLVTVCVNWRCILGLFYLILVTVDAMTS